MHSCPIPRPFLSNPKTGVEAGLGNVAVEHTVQRKAFEEKTFANFEVLWLFVQVFSVKFGGVAQSIISR